MKYIYILLAFCFKLSLSAGLSFTGSLSRVIEITPDANTGLEAIYVLEDCDNVTMSYSCAQGDKIEWAQFSTLGGAYSEPINSDISGDITSIQLKKGDMGYIVTVNGRQHCFWIIDYSDHELSLHNIAVDNNESDCTMTAISINGLAPRIVYYTVNGVPKELSRDIEISYSTLEWNDDSNNYIPTDKIYCFGSLSKLTYVEAPLCDTKFLLTGDRFLKEWKKEISFETDFYQAIAVDAHASATQNRKENDNEIKDNISDLGGSAPVDITFSAVTTDAVAFREWQLSRDPLFDNIDLRFNQDDVDYTFHDQGTTYARLIVANGTGDCEWTSDVFQVNIGDSRLECPNAFSPGASEGVNDEWKVSYRSIIKYECHIFNRWGTQLFESNNPAVGWDGKYNGKLVPAGVYFYVIKAKGADGKEYNRSGDINIINYKKATSLPSQE